MDQSKKDIFYRVLIIHVVVLIILFLFSFVKGCFKKEISSEIVTYIDFNYDAEPSPNVSTLENSTSQVSSKPKWKPKTVDEIVKGKKIEKIETNNEEKKKVLNKLKKKGLLECIFCSSKKKWNLFFKEAPLILLFIDQTHKEFDQAELFLNLELNLQTI